MRHARQTGFTLVELILVIVLMGLLAGIALPRLMDRQSLDEVNVNNELKAMLRLARKVAVTQSREVCLMRTAAQVILVYEPTGVPCSLAGTPVKEPGSGDDMVLLLQPAGLGGTTSVVTITGSTTVRFNARGQLLVPAAANAQITVGSVPVLNVDKETGFVY